MNEKVAKTKFEEYKENIAKDDLEQSSELDKAFVTQEERVLDPELLLPYKGKGVTESGIQLVKETVDREALSTVICYVLKLGPLAYQDQNKFGDDPWCKKGDWILIGRYAGTRFRLEDDHEVRIINDDEVIATILNPDDIKSL